MITFNNDYVFCVVSASVIVSALMDVALKKKPSNLGHLRFLVTGQLDSLKIICYNKDDTDKAIQLLSAAALRRSV